jgi:hypothetical protein
MRFMSRVPTKALLLAGTAALLLAALWGVRTLATSEAVPCTIEDVAAFYDISLETTSVALGDGVPASVAAQVQKRAIGASVVDQRVFALRSEAVPLVDGHRALVLRLDHVPDGVIEGPAGQDRIPGEVKCAIAIYDADTGAFLVSFQRLEPRP